MNTASAIAFEDVDIGAVIASGRYDLTSEHAAQDGIEARLRAVFGDRVEREFRLSDADRPDFFIDGETIIEVKVKGAHKMNAFKQLTRYAKDPRVKRIILATSQAMNLPPTINGKPAKIVSLGTAWL